MCIPEKPSDGKRVVVEKDGFVNMESLFSLLCVCDYETGICFASAIARRRDEIGLGALLFTPPAGEDV